MSRQPPLYIQDLNLKSNYENKSGKTISDKGIILLPYKMSIFERSITCSFFFMNCTHILTGTQGEKFEDMFRVKIANRGTTLKELHLKRISALRYAGVSSGSKHNFPHSAVRRDTEEPYQGV